MREIGGAERNDRLRIFFSSRAKKRTFFSARFCGAISGVGSNERGGVERGHYQGESGRHNRGSQGFEIHGVRYEPPIFMCALWMIA